MPRPASATSALLSDLQSRLAGLVASARAEGRAKALDEIRSLVGGAAAPVKRGPGRPPKSASPAPAAAAKSRKKRKSSWAGLSAEQRLARVNAIRKGKGLPPRASL